jgi:formamidopyrimidine-DNA glycosylase
MPELPEVEAVVRRLRMAAPWARVVSCGQFRPTTMQGAERAIGRRIEAVERRGKNIVVQLSGGAFLRVHLKMTGNFVVLPDLRRRPASVRAWFGLEDGRGLVLNDPRALGRISFHEESERAALFAGLGPEPADAAFTVAHLTACAKKTVKPVKLLLMEQRAVVGLGNIYAAEALFQAGIDPRKAASRISGPKLRALHGAIVEVLRIALDSAVAAYEQPGGFTEGENFPVAVYGREGECCFRCRGVIRRIPQGGRSTYYCPRCQK